MIRKLIALLICLLVFAGCSNTSTKQSDASKEEKYARIRGINLAAEGKNEEALKNFMIAYKYDKKNKKSILSSFLVFSSDKYFKELSI